MHVFDAKRAFYFYKCVLHSCHTHVLFKLWVISTVVICYICAYVARVLLATSKISLVTLLAHMSKCEV